MEPSGRNRWQPVANGIPPKPLKQANPQPVATHGNRSGAHGKGRVDAPSLFAKEGVTFIAPQKRPSPADPKARKTRRRTLTIRWWP
jgi:hypothetical protein